MMMVDASPAELPPLVLLGGSFDPIHHGHLRAALDAARVLGSATVTLLPAGTPALRDPLRASSAQRLAMLQRAIAGEPTLAIDHRELSREGPTYTVETLRELRQQWPHRSIIFLLGADAFSRLPRWHEWTSLLDLAHLAVLSRPSEPLHAPADAAFAACFEAEAAALTHAACGRWTAIDVTPLTISASAIRALIGAGQSPRYLLPDPVIDYIAQERLYGYPGKPVARA